MNDHFSARLAQTLEESYGLRLDSLHPLAGGLDSKAQAYKADCRGHQFVVKVRPDLPSGLLLSHRLQQVGITEAVAPIFNKLGAPATTFEARHLLLYPFVEPSEHPSDESADGVWRDVGRVLRQVHGSDVSDVPLARESFDVTGVEAFEERTRRFVGGQSQFVGEEILRDVLRSNEEGITRTVNRVAELGETHKRSAHDLVPCHADLHAYNILVSDDTVRLIDWDTAKLAPRECDLMFFLDGGILAHEERVGLAFMAGYGRSSLDHGLLAYFRYARALEDFIAFLGDAVDESSAIESARWIGLQFDDQGVVDLADRSYSRYRDEQV